MEVQVWLGMREIQRSVEEACTIAQIPEWANQVGERENSDLPMQTKVRLSSSVCQKFE